MGLCGWVFLGVCVGLGGCVSECAGVSRCAWEYPGVRECVPMCAGMCRCMGGCGMNFQNTLADFNTYPL